MELTTDTTNENLGLLPKLVQTLADDPLLTNILFTILRNPNITAKEMKKSFPKLKGTSIYYYLNTLADNGFINIETEIISRTNLIQKKYSVNPELFSQEFVEDMRSGKDRNTALMSLFLAQQFINNQIHRILNMDDETFAEFAGNEQIKTVSGFALTKEIPEIIVSKYNEIYPLLQKESSSKLGETFGERAQQGDRFFFICNLPYN
jgi:DNA-binding PadR family transcriptional regulator